MYKNILKKILIYHSEIPRFEEKLRDLAILIARGVSHWWILSQNIFCDLMKYAAIQCYANQNNHIKAERVECISAVSFEHILKV